MTEKQITPQDPYSLIIAVENQSDCSKIENEAVWEIQLDGGENGGLSLYTTLSLNASSLRIFPIFSNKAETKIKLSQFTKPISIIKILPAYAKFRLEPFPGLIVNIEYWAKESNLLLGRIYLTNSSKTPFDGSIAWAVQLLQLNDVSNMSVLRNAANPYLYGKTTQDHLAFVLNGAPDVGKFGQFSVENSLELAPSAQQVFQWAFTAEKDKDSAFRTANLWANRPLEAEIARMEVDHQRDIYQIETGNREWDLALSLSQTSAQQLVCRSANGPPNTYIFKSRTPEQKNLPDSAVSKGMQSNQMNPLELWYLMQVLPSIAPVILDNLTEILAKLNTQTDLVTTDSSHYKQQYFPYPILATTILQILQYSPNRTWLQDHFNSLINYLKLWFGSNLTGSSSTIPTWQNSLHSLVENNPIHNRWSIYGEGLNTQYIKSPMLLSLLLQEIKNTKKLGKLIADQPAQDWLDEKESFLIKQINSLWDGKKHHYVYKDIATDKSYLGTRLISASGSGKYRTNKKLRFPQRLNLRFHSQQEHTRNVKLVLYGEHQSVPIVEEIKPRDIHWFGQDGFYTSHAIFEQLIKIEIFQFPASDSVIVQTCDFARTDLSLAFPIWATDAEEKKMKLMVEKWLIPDLMQPFGLPMVPISEQPPQSDQFNSVNLTLNCFLLQGLLQYDYDHFAKQIFTNNLLAVTKNLKLFHRFMQQYDASDGYGTGEYNIINGLIPISIFLNLAGIRRWSTSEVIIDNISAFEKPITIFFRGNTIKTSSFGHTFYSPGGTIITTTGKGPHHIRIPE